MSGTPRPLHFVLLVKVRFFFTTGSTAHVPSAAADLLWMSLFYVPESSFAVLLLVSDVC